MNGPEMRWFRRLAALGILALFILVGVSVATYIYYLATSSTIQTGTFRPFFPFGWLGGLFFIFIAFWFVRWIFWPWSTTLDVTGGTETTRTTYYGRDTLAERSRRSNLNR